jgi:hypothetical protein
MNKQHFSVLAVICLCACTSITGLPTNTLPASVSSPLAEPAVLPAPYPSPAVQKNERWIEVDLLAQKVRLYSGNDILVYDFAYLGMSVWVH